MTLLGRIIVILFALWLATIAAGLVWSFGLLGAEWQQMTADPAGRIVFWGAAFLASGITASLLFLPMLIAIVLAEAFSIRSLLIYAVGGAALTLLAYHGAGFGKNYEESIDRAPPPISREFEIAAAAGAAFGFVYWIVAGRRAGRWRGVA
ncbi:MAG: hypothetical protein JO254_15905 [Pseudolabrys sp.]|nr:hypothetical protein [Pseudolabrys sp.]